MRKRRNATFSLSLLTALLVLLVAFFTGASLWVLRGLHRQSARIEAARLVLAQGQRMAAQLSEQPVVQVSRGEEGEWTGFLRQFRAYYAIEDGVQYVSVAKDGVTVFHKQTTALDATLPPEPDLTRVRDPGDVRMTRKIIQAGGDEVPVVAFTRTFTGEDGLSREVEIAIRRDTVAREGETATAALGSMFRLSLATVLASFGVCALLVVWMMHRDHVRERQRREEEHLAFAGVLANGIVHDFRNPMSSMRLDVQMLNKEVGKGDQARSGRVAELAGRVQQTIDRLDKVFQEFLYVSKPPSAEQERTDLRACVRECVELLAPRLEQAGVKLALDMPDVPVEVMAYRSSLQRAIMNVITNAEQHSQAGDTVSVAITATGKQVSLDVRDQGPGIAPADRKRIFEMFTSERPGGTGLGLFLARTAVERCGGTIGIVDAEEGGACFRISLTKARAGSE